MDFFNAFNEISLPIAIDIIFFHSDDARLPVQQQQQRKKELNFYKH